MTPRRTPGPRFALPDLAARFVVFVSLAGVTEFLVYTIGLRFVVTGLPALPAAVLLAWHWPYAAGNRFVLAAVAPWLAYLAFAWSYGTAEGTQPGLLRVYLFNCLLLALVAAHVARSSDAAVRGLIGVARIALLVSVASVLFTRFNPPTPAYAGEFVYGMYRPAGFFASPNDAAMACVLFLNFVLYRPWNQRTLNWFAGAAAAAATVFTLSKSGFVLLLASLVLFLWIRRKRMVLAVVTVAVLSVLASARPIFDVFAPRAFSLRSSGTERAFTNRLEDVVDLVEGNPTARAVGFRHELWPDGITLIRDTFPHGSGFGSFRALEGSVFGTELSDWYGIHNMYLLVAGEAGFVVFALLVFCYGGLLARAWWFSPRDGLPFAIIVVMLIYWGVIHNFLDHRFYIVSFAVTVGLLARRGAGGRAAFDAGDAAPRRA